MFGRFHEWPLRPGILASMPFSLMLRGARDLVFKERLPGESFEADVVNKYGRTLYEIFFKPYTRKFLFYSPAQLHRDWARAGVNRAVIDQRAGSDNLWSLLKNTLMPRPVETMFLYPPHGVGRFSDLLAEGIGEMGGRLRARPLGDGSGNRARPDHRHPDGGRAHPLRPDRLDGALDDAERPGRRHGIDLEYLSTIFYNLEIGKPGKLDYQWTYFGGDEIFSRVTAPEAFLAHDRTAGQERAVRRVHLPRRGRALADIPSAIRRRSSRTWSGHGAIDRATDVERVHIERVPFTYPIYKLNYLGELTRNLQGPRRATRTCCWPAAADASGTTTWITRSARA